MSDPKKEFQRIFEFVAKNRDNTIPWPNSDIKKFLRWALYYRKLFIVWAPSGTGKADRIAAIGVAWRTEKVEEQDHELTFENTEFGEKLFVFQVIVHPEFRNAGTLFTLLSLASYRYPGVDIVFWNSEHRGTGKFISISFNKLISRLSNQVSPKRLKKFVRRELWEEKTKLQPSPTLPYLQ